MTVLQKIRIALERWMTRRHYDNSDAAKACCVGLTRTLVQCALENSHWEYYFDKGEDCFYGTLSVKNMTDVILTLKPHENYIHAQSIALKRPVLPLKLTEALLFCNKWNNKRLFPKAYIDEFGNALIGETIMTFGEEVSEEFVRECILETLLKANTAFFEEAGKCKFLPERMTEC